MSRETQQLAGDDACGRCGRQALEREAHQVVVRRREAGGELGWCRRAADAVPQPGVLDVDAAVATQPRAPAQVEVFPLEKEGLVEAAQLEQQLPPDKHRGAVGAHGGNVVVARDAVIEVETRDEFTHQPTAGERRPRLHIPLTLPFDLARVGGEERLVCDERVREYLDATLVESDVVVKQEHELGRCRACALVVEVAEPAVLAAEHARALSSAANDRDAPWALYVHLPFCAHRCGYCDFVTVTGRDGEHGAYVDALLTELVLERHDLAAQVESVFLGGGTPTFTDASALARLLAGLPRAQEKTVEANPETVTPALAALLREHGVDRVSLGAQSFQPHLLAVLERRARPDDVRRAVENLREAGFDNVSLDLIYGIPGQTTTDLERDLADAVALAPEHVSAYELEAKPGTRFTHAHGAELARQAEVMEDYFERVVETFAGAGYRWYETANFCLSVPGRDLRARHNLGYWRGRDYLGIGVGAVSTLAGRRIRNAPGLHRYLAALGRGERPPREVEELDEATRLRERVMLGLRLDDPLARAGLDAALDADALARLARHGLLTADAATIALTRRGRFLGGGVTAELLAAG